MAGFEPADVGSKGRCLTTWLHPNLNLAKFRTTKLKLNYELNKSNIEIWYKIKSKVCKSL